MCINNSCISHLLPVVGRIHLPVNHEVVEIHVMERPQSGKISIGKKFWISMVTDTRTLTRTGTQNVIARSGHVLPKFELVNL